MVYAILALTARDVNEAAVTGIIGAAGFVIARRSGYEDFVRASLRGLSLTAITVALASGALADNSLSVLEIIGLGLWFVLGIVGLAVVFRESARELTGH